MKALLAVASLLLTVYSPVSAQVIALNPTGPIDTTSLTVAGDILFADNNAYTDFSDLPTYATLSQENLTYPESFGAPLTINGVTHTRIGVTYNNAGPATANPVTGAAEPGTGTPVDLATFALGASVPTAGFEVGVFSNYPDTSYYTIGLYNGNPATTGTLIGTSTLLNPLQTPNDNGSNATPRSDDEFYYADVVGATSGDYLLITGNGPHTNGDSQVTLGGVVFITPEPSTYALMFTGMGMMLLVARLRRRGAASLSRILFQY